MRIAVQRGELIFYGRCGIFRDQRSVIGLDLESFTYCHR